MQAGRGAKPATKRTTGSQVKWEAGGEPAHITTRHANSRASPASARTSSGKNGSTSASV